MLIKQALPQSSETPVTVFETARFAYRCAYARAEESQSAAENGQDFVTLQHDEQRMAFSICDGVSQSFYGDLAARLVGQALLDWFWDAGAGDPGVFDSPAFEPALVEYLQELTAEATRQVTEQALPPGLLPILQRVLEQKRAQGSESMFVAALVDTTQQRLCAAWSGDIRLYVLDPREQLLLRNQPRTQQRWSSARGLIGTLNVLALPLGQVGRVLAYTDGLAALDASGGEFYSSLALEKVIQDSFLASSSDDLSCVEVCLPGSIMYERLLKEGAGSWTA